MQDKRYIEAKKEIRSVLITYPNGVSLQEFLKCYRNLTYESLPTKLLGYSSDIALLESMPDVVHMNLNEYGKYHLFGIADSASAHIQKLVRNQRLPKMNNSSKTRYPNKFFHNASPVVENYNSRKVFVSAELRAEMLHLMSMFPHGINLSSLVLAYKKMFNKHLTLGTSCDNVEDIINSILELEVRIIHREKRVFVKNKDSIKPRNFQNSNNFSDVIKNKEVLKFDKCGVPESIQNNLKEVLKKCSEGILAIHFPPLYEKVTGMKLELHALGYTSIYDLCDALPSIFTRTFNSKSGGWIIYPAGTKRSHLISKTPSSIDDQVFTKPSSPTIFKPTTPSDIVPSSLQCKDPRLPENIDLDEAFPIFISAAVNPGQFWFQLLTNEVSDTFEKLEKELQYFYNNNFDSKYKMKEQDVKRNSFCVARCPEDKRWYRAVIKSIPASEIINVCCVDYGSRLNVPKRDLRYLKLEFYNLPAQAFPAQLANLKPAYNDWSSQAKECFIQFCENPYLMAKLKQLNDMFSVYLCDTSGDEDLYINDILIKEGHAEFSFENDFTSHFPQTGNNNVSVNCIQNRETSEKAFNTSSSSSSHGSLDEDNSYLLQNLEGKGILNSSLIADSITERLENHSTLNESSKPSPGHHVISVKRLENPLIPNDSSTPLPDHHVISDKRFESHSMPNDSSKPLPDHRIISVKKINLCCDYQYHVINFQGNPYITAGDLSKLLWNSKDLCFLTERLKYKDITIPCVEISKDDFPKLFQELQRAQVSEFSSATFKDPFVTLYTLQRSLEILNIFGHPSVCVRLSIKNEIKIFNPSTWKEFTSSTDGLEDYPMLENLEKLCLYDLKTKYEALEVKKLKLRYFSENSSSDEVIRIENIQKVINNRIKYIEHLCLEYSS